LSVRRSRCARRPCCDRHGPSGVAAGRPADVGCSRGRKTSSLT